MESSASAGRVASAVLDPRRWWALALLCGAFFMVLLDGTITIVALPSIGAGLRFSEQGLQRVLSAYALTFGGLLLLGGRAADLLGRQRVFTAGVVFFTAASLLCGLAWSPAALLAARVVQGACAAIMTPTALSIISATFAEGSERNQALGIWGALGGVGATTAWLIGGPLVDGPGWRWIFFINIPVGLAALALSPVLLPDSRAVLTRRSYDPAGALILLVVRDGEREEQRLGAESSLEHAGGGQRAARAREQDRLAGIDRLQRRRAALRRAAARTEPYADKLSCDHTRMLAGIRRYAGVGQPEMTRPGALQ